MPSIGPPAQPRPIAAGEVIVSMVQRKGGAQPKSALGKAAASEPPQPKYTRNELFIDESGEDTAWLSRPLTQAPEALARRVELFADGSTRVTHHVGNKWARIEARKQLWELGDCALSPVGREMMDYIQRQAAAQSAALAASVASAAVGAGQTGSRTRQALGVLAVMISSAMLTSLALTGATLAVVGSVAVAYAALLLHLWGVGTWYSGLAKAAEPSRRDEAAERACLALTHEAQLFEQLSRFDFLVLRDEGEDFQELTPALQKIWGQRYRHDTWFTTLLRLLGRLPENPSPLLRLTVEEICGKIARCDVRDEEIDAHRCANACEVILTGLDALYDRLPPSAFERFVLDGSVGQTQLRVLST